MSHPVPDVLWKHKKQDWHSDMSGELSWVNSVNYQDVLHWLETDEVRENNKNTSRQCPEGKGKLSIQSYRVGEKESGKEQSIHFKALENIFCSLF